MQMDWQIVFLNANTEFLATPGYTLSLIQGQASPMFGAGERATAPK